jgi:hypothetical protein
LNDCEVRDLTSIPGLDFHPVPSTRKTADIECIAIPFISLADLITAKRTAGREQDLRDIAGLERLLGDEESGQLL